MGYNGSFGSLGRSLIPIMLVYSIDFFGHVNGIFIIGVYTFASGFIILGGLSFFNRNRYNLKAMNSNKNIKSQKNIKFRDYSKFLYILALIVFVRSMFLVGTVTFVPDYLDNVLHSTILMGYVTSISFLSAVIGQPYFGSMVRKHGGKFTIAITSIISTVFFGIFLLVRSFDLLTLIYMIYVFAAFSGFPVLLGYVAQVIPTEFSTQSNALIWSFGNIVGGSAGIALVTLLLYVHVTLYDSMVYMLIFAVLSVVLLPLLPSKTSGQEKQGAAA